MNAFLSTVASQFTDPNELQSALVVFPTKRAGLFFSEILGKHFNKTIWLPEITTLDELAARIGSTSALDTNAQVFTLFNIYRKLVPDAETISRFFTWGNMLLSDFNDIDASLADAEKVLEYVGSIKEIDLRFEGLEPEQIEHLKMFWNSINVADNSDVTEEKQRFLAFWQQLPMLYKLYTEKCEELKAGARGFRLKKAVEFLEQSKWEDASQYKTIVIAGFNQLSKAEEKLICLLIEKYQAKIVWDYNPWYLQMGMAEVSQYYNRYKKHYLLSETLPKFPKDDITIPETTTESYICGGLTEEVKLTANLIRQLPSETGYQKVAVIIPDGSYLISLLHAIPKEIGTINVTLQFPFKQTTLYSFLQSYIRLRESGKTQYESPEMLSFLRNDYVRSIQSNVEKEIISKIVSNKKQYVYTTEFIEGSKLQSLLFTRVTQPAQVFSLLFELLNTLVTPNVSTDWFKNSFEEQFYHIAFLQLSSLQEVLNTYDSGVEPYDVWRLALQVLGGAQIPFLGEPLIGLQIMQLRESMTLDFDTVFILGANEGSLPPKFQSRGSFVPYNLRKGFGLPLPEQLAANFSYQFFRLLSRSKTAHILYSVGSDDTSNNEPTRFLGQLKYLLNYPIAQTALSTTVGTGSIPPIVIPKTQAIVDRLKIRFGTTSKGISPSAINEYLECSLRFYLHRMAYLSAPEEVVVGMDAATIGTLFHESIEAGYKPYEGKGIILQESDFEQVRKLAFTAFYQKIEQHFGVPAKEVKGESILTIELIKNYLNKVITADSKLTDLQIVAQEAQKPLLLPITLADGTEFTIQINGKIDRIDRVGDTLRIIDYKTGKDVLLAPNVEALFERSAQKSVKAIMQVFVYAIMYLQDTDTQFEPGIYKLAEMISPGYDPLHNYKIQINDYEKGMPFDTAYLNKFKQLIGERLATLFDLNLPFTQTENSDNCKYCEFKPMCGR